MANGFPVVAHADEMKRCLVDCDVEAIRRLWAHVAPNMPQPEDDNHARATIHHARTQAENIPFKLRAYSHAWLTERGFPSALPDHMRPRAQRMYPVIVDAVGISVGGAAHRRDLQLAVRGAMSDAVMECYADNNKDPTFVSARMREARMKVYRYA
jgi:hypothetical protein